MTAERKLQGTGWALAWIAWKAAKQLGDAVQVKIHGSIEQTREDTRTFFRHSITGQAARDQRIIVRPNAAVVITHRVVARLRGDHGADAPSGKRLGRQERLGQASSSLRERYTGKQALPRVGSPHPAGTLVAIERNGVSA